MEKTSYKKTGNAGSQGVEFQVSLLAVFVLNAFRRKLKNWRLSTENERAGKFDDVVLEFSEGAVLLQAKHKEGKKKKITLEDLMSVNSKNEFSLPKYFLSYQKIKHKFTIRNIIVCTNIGMDDEVATYLESRNVCPESMLYCDDNSSTFYTFKENISLNLKEKVKKYFEENSRDMHFDESVISDESIQDFLKHLHFYFGYPSGYDLRNIIEQILKHMDLRRTISSMDIHDKVMDWFQRIDRKAHYLNETYAKAIFSEICRDKHWESLEKYNVHFERNDFNFTQHTKQVLLVTANGGHFLQEIKIYRALQSDKKNILYFNSADDTKIQKQALEAFNLPSYKFLIIVCQALTEKTVASEICDRLSIILDKYKYKKIILVADSDNNPMKQIEFGTDKYEVIDGTVLFRDLFKETQQKILKNKSIEFQGKYVSLEELLGTPRPDDFEKVMHPEILEKIIRNENITIGQTLQKISRHYINRTFLSDINENQHETVTMSEENIYEVVKDKMILVTDSAGMGKSTVLVKLAEVIKQQNPHLWVIRIELNHHTAYLREILKRETMIDIMELLFSTKEPNYLERFVFTLHGKIVLMLDGVDEISPDFTDLVVTFLVQCHDMSNFARVFVTSRPHMTELLETKLQVKSFTLLRFTEQNQIDFLTDYWAYNLGLDEINREKCEQYAKALISKIDLNALFTAIPLQVFMVAEIFQQNDQQEDWVGCKEYLSDSNVEFKSQKNLNITKLYQLFIEKKRDVFLERSNPTGNPAANRSLIDQFNDSLVYHRALALKEVLYSFQSELFTSYREVVADMEEVILKIGIVQKVDDQLHFLHRTFAEYFVAESIVQELQIQNPNVEFQQFFVDEVLLEGEFNIVRAFINYFLQDVLNSLSSDTLQKYKHTFDSNWNKWENFSLIHHLVKEDHQTILQFLLRCINFKIIKGREVDISDLFELDGQDENQVQIFGNTLAALEYLTSQGGVNIKNQYNETPLHCAVQEGRLEMIKFLLEQGADIGSQKWDLSSLNYAVQRGQFEIIKLLIEQVGDTGDWTVLQISIEEKQDEIATYFIERILEKGDVTGREPILAYAAAYLGRLDVLKELVERGLDLSSKVENGKPLIFGAVQGQRSDLIKYLVQQGVDVNSEDNSHNTSLHSISEESSFISTAKLLLDLGVDINRKNYGDETALQIAIEKGNSDMVKLLVEHGADVNCKNILGRTTLCLAASLGNLDVVNVLVENGGDINATDENGNTVIHWAVHSNNSEIVKFFLSHTTDINIRNNRGQTALHLAAKYADGDIIDLLLKHGADLNAKDFDGRTALHFATKLLWLSNKIELFVELGLDIKARDNLGRTPLHLACMKGEWDCIEALLKYDAEVDVPDNQGRTPLFLAIEKATTRFQKLISRRFPSRNYAYHTLCNNLEIAMKLVYRYKADVNARDNMSSTILHKAALEGPLYTVKFIVDQLNADVNVRDANGHTPLHLAAGKSATSVVKFLVERGAEVSVEDCDSDTAADFARKNGHLHLLEDLKAEDTVPRRRRIFCCFGSRALKTVKEENTIRSPSFFSWPRGSKYSNS